MINILKEKEIKWKEPKNLDRLKRNLKNEDENSFIVRNCVKLLVSFLFFSFLFLYWYFGGKFASREMKLLPVLIICISVSFLFVKMNDIMYKLFGYSIVTLRDDYIFYDRSGKNLNQWSIKNIHTCKILSGSFNSRPYRALLIADKKNKKQIFIINKNIETEKVSLFFQNNGLECTEDVLNF